MSFNPWWLGGPPWLNQVEIACATWGSTPSSQGSREIFSIVGGLFCGKKSDGFVGQTLEHWEFLVLKHGISCWLMINISFYWLNISCFVVRYDFGAVSTWVLALSHSPIIPWPCFSSHWLQQAMKRWLLRENLEGSRGMPLESTAGNHGAGFKHVRILWFVVWNIFFHILGLIIPTDFHIFQRGWNDQPGLVFVSSPTGRMYWHHIWHYCMNIWHYIFDNMDMGQNPSNPFGSHQYIAEISGCSSPL